LSRDQPTRVFISLYKLTERFEHH